MKMDKLWKQFHSEQPQCPTKNKHDQNHASESSPVETTECGRMGLCRGEEWGRVNRFYRAKSSPYSHFNTFRNVVYFFYLFYFFFLFLLFFGPALTQKLINNFCHDLKQIFFVVTTYAQKGLFYSMVFKNFEKYHFSHSKKAVNYAKIDRVGSLGPGFQQVLLVQNFWKFLYMYIVIEHHK